MLRRFSVLMAVVMLVAGGCTQGEDAASDETSSTVTSAVAPATSTTTATTTTTTATSATTAATRSTGAVRPDSPLSWMPCSIESVDGTSRDGECATLTVPLDHDDPSTGTVDLSVVRVLASVPEERIGVLLYDGAPLASTGIPFLLHQMSSDELARRFDLVAFETRGATSETGVHCGLPSDVFLLDPTPETPEEAALIEQRYREFAMGCGDNSGDTLPHLSTVSTARDIEMLRVALGEEQISYFGESYGAGRGSVFATLFPESVRAMVLSAGFFLDQSLVETLVWSMSAQERALSAALDQCADDPSCPFHSDGNPHDAFDELLADLDADPLVVDGLEVGLAEVLLVIQVDLYSDRWWPDLMQTLSDLRDGDGSALVPIRQEFSQQINEAGRAVLCLDTPRRESEMDQVLIDEILTVAPRLGPFHIDNVDVCRFWPIEPDPPPPVAATGAGPILVLGTSGSPWVPIEESRALAEQLDDAVLLIDDRNEKYPYILPSPCIDAAVDNYLIDLETPAHLSVCAPTDPQIHPPG